jgi:hypothetical protein
LENGLGDVSAKDEAVIICLHNVPPLMYLVENLYTRVLFIRIALDEHIIQYVSVQSEVVDAAGVHVSRL